MDVHVNKNDRNRYIGELITNDPYSTQGRKIPITALVLGETILIYYPALEINITERIVNGELQGTWSFPMAKTMVNGEE